MRNDAKAKKGHPVSVRFDADVEAAIKAIAANEDRSVPYVVNALCRRALEARGDLQGPTSRKRDR